MKKIAKIIKRCNDCEHCACTSAKNESLYFAVCTFNSESNFLLFNGTEPPFRFNLNIPENCPLEDYTGNQTIKE